MSVAAAARAGVGVVKDCLTASDPHHWHPVPEVLAFLTRRLPKDARVLELGPGSVPFARADVYVDFVPLPHLAGKELIICDVAREPLPFPDKAFDFVVCRHMLEDMWNPFPVCAEMARVAKAGYIETPSPLAEFCRGVDGGSPAWRGYHHHRFMVWQSAENELAFASKFPIIEYVSSPSEHDMVAALRNGAYWNSYFLWKDEFSVRHLQCPFDFMITDNYAEVISNAIRQSITATDQFITKITETPWPSTS